MNQHVQRANRLGKRTERTKLSAEYFQTFGFMPTSIIDIGVWTGTDWLYDSFPKCKFHLIDPLPQSEDSSARWRDKIDFDFHRMAVGAQESELHLQVPKRGQRMLYNMTSSAPRSAENMSTQGIDETVEITAQVVPLDTLARNWTGPFGIKIDTEGHELDVIHGATETLKSAEFVVCEVTMGNRFENGYRFSDLIAAMGENGFQPLEFLSGTGSKPLITDILFVPQTS